MEISKLKMSRTQSKNLFDLILNFGFNLGRLKCTPAMLDGVNFAKDYQKDSYNKIILIDKNRDNKENQARSKNICTFKNVKF